MNLKRNVKSRGRGNVNSINGYGDIGSHEGIGAGILMMVWIFGLLGCGSLRDLSKEKNIIRSASDSSLVYTALEKQRVRRDLEAVVVTRDSLKADFTFEVWPRGKFSYSPEKGFEGEALKLMISGSQKREGEVLERRTLQEELSRVNDHRFQSQHKAEGVEKTGQVRRTIGWKMILGFLALTGTLMILALRCISKHRPSFWDRNTENAET